MTSKNAETRYFTHRGKVYVRSAPRAVSIGQLDSIPFTDHCGVKFTLWTAISRTGRVREGFESRAEALRELEKMHVATMVGDERSRWVQAAGEIPPLPPRWYEMPPERGRELTRRVDEMVKQAYGDSWSFWELDRYDRDHVEEQLTEQVLRLVNRSRCTVRWDYADEGVTAVGVRWEVEQGHPRTPLDSEVILSGMAVL